MRATPGASFMETAAATTTALVIRTLKARHPIRGTFCTTSAPSAATFKAFVLRESRRAPYALAISLVNHWLPPEFDPKSRPESAKESLRSRSKSLN